MNILDRFYNDILIGTSKGKVSIEELDDQQLMIQNNLTKKFIRTFLSVAHHRNDIEVLNYPLDVDFNMRLRLLICFKIKGLIILYLEKKIKLFLKRVVFVNKRSICKLIV